MDVIVPTAVTLVTILVLALYVGTHHSACPSNIAINSTDGDIEEGTYNAANGDTEGVERGDEVTPTTTTPSSSSSNGITTAWHYVVNFFTLTRIQTVQTFSSNGSGGKRHSCGGHAPPPMTSSLTLRSGKKSRLGDKQEELLSAAYDRLLSPPDFPLANQVCAEYFSSSRSRKEGGEGGGMPHPCVTSTSPSSWVVGYYQRALPTNVMADATLAKETIMHLDKYSLLSTTPGTSPQTHNNENNKSGSNSTAAATFTQPNYSTNPAGSVATPSIHHYASLDNDITGMVTYIKELKESVRNGTASQDTPPSQQPTKPRHTATISFLQRRKTRAYQSAQLLEAVFRALPPVRYRRRVRIVYSHNHHAAAGDSSPEVGANATNTTKNPHPNFEVAYLPDYSDSRVSLTSAQLTDIGLSGLRNADSNDARHLLAQMALYVDGEDCGADPTKALSISTPIGQTVLDGGNCNSMKLGRIRKAVTNMANIHAKKRGGLRTMMVVTGEPRQSAFRAIRSMLQQIVHTRSESPIPTDVDIIYSLSSGIQSLVSDPIVADVFKLGGMAAVDSFLVRTLCPPVMDASSPSPSPFPPLSLRSRVCIISEILDPFRKDSYAGREALLRWLLDFTLHRKPSNTSSSTSSPTMELLQRVAYLPHALGGLPHSTWAMTALSARAMMYAFAEVRRLESHPDLRPIHHGSIVIRDGHTSSSSSASPVSSSDDTSTPGPRKHLLRYDYFIITRVDSLFTLPLQDYSWLGSRVVCYGNKTSSAPPYCHLHPPRLVDGTTTTTPSDSPSSISSARSPIPYAKVFEEVPPRKYERETGDLSTCVIPLGSQFGGYPDSHSICSRRGALVHANIVESALQISIPKLQQELGKIRVGPNAEKFLMIKFEKQDVNVLYGPAGSHFVSCGPSEGQWDSTSKMGFACLRQPNVMCLCDMVTHSSISASTPHHHPNTSKIMGTINGENIVENLAGGGGSDKSLSSPTTSPAFEIQLQEDGNTTTISSSSPPIPATSSPPQVKSPPFPLTSPPFIYYAIPPTVGFRMTQSGEFVSARNAHGMYFRFPPTRHVSNRIQHSERQLAMALLEGRGLNTGYVNEGLGTGVATCADFAVYVVDLHLAAMANRTRLRRETQQMPENGDSAAPTTTSPKGADATTETDWVTIIQKDMETFKARRKGSLVEFPVRNAAHTVLLSQEKTTDTLFTLPDRLLQHYCALREGSSGSNVEVGHPVDRIQMDIRDALAEVRGASSPLSSGKEGEGGVAASGKEGGGEAKGGAPIPTLHYNEWGDFDPAGTPMMAGSSSKQQYVLSLPLVDRNHHIPTSTTPHLGWQPIDSHAPVAALWGRLPPNKVKRK